MQKHLGKTPVPNHPCSIRRASCLALALFLFAPVLSHAAPATRILILHSYSQEYPWTRGQHDGFVETLAADDQLEFLVDDVKEQRELATELLKKLNYGISSVASGEEAVTYLKGRPCDLLILDMIMDPGMDGLDTYKKVLEISPEQKAIIVSGFSESNRVRAVHALGAGGYVRKPYTIEKLGLAVRKELDRTK